MFGNSTSKYWLQDLMDTFYKTHRRNKNCTNWILLRHILGLKKLILYSVDPGLSCGCFQKHHIKATQTFFANKGKTQWSLSSTAIVSLITRSYNNTREKQKIWLISNIEDVITYTNRWQAYNQKYQVIHYFALQSLD